MRCPLVSGNVGFSNGRGKDSLDRSLDRLLQYSIGYHGLGELGTLARYEASRVGGYDIKGSPEGHSFTLVLYSQHISQHTFISPQAHHASVPNFMLSLPEAGGLVSIVS